MIEAVLGWVSLLQLEAAVLFVLLLQGHMSDLYVLILRSPVKGTAGRGTRTEAQLYKCISHFCLCQVLIMSLAKASHMAKLNNKGQ